MEDGPEGIKAALKEKTDLLLKRTVDLFFLKGKEGRERLKMLQVRELEIDSKRKRKGNMQTDAERQLEMGKEE